MMSFKISRRDPALGDVSDKALGQLTQLLYMDSSKYFGDDFKEWLVAQERQVKDLDPTLLRPKDLLARFAISMSRTLPTVCPERAKLCSSHKALDPRVIRNVLLLIADECTIQTNRYRSSRLREELTPSLAGWLDRIDFITALWLGEETFKRVFRCSPADHLPECVRSKCEACILAVIGGSALYLTDLRASLLARHAYVGRLTGQAGREPRLLRVIDSWISFYQPDCQEIIRECSESVVEDIVEMRTAIRRRWDRESERCRRRGKMPRMQRHLLVRLTEEGLPMPRQPRYRTSKTKRRQTQQGRRRTEEQVLERGPEGRMWHILGGSVKARSDPGLGIYVAHGRSGGEEKGKGPANSHYEREEWEDWEEDEEEYWVKDYRNLILRGDDDEAPSIIGKDSSKQLDVSSTLSFGINTRLCTSVNAGSWTSKIDGPDDSDVESPREIDVPLLYRDSRSIEDDDNDNEPPTPTRPVSSVYSTDPGYLLPSTRYVAPARPIIPVEQTISMLSSVRRDSAMPLPLRVGKVLQMPQILEEKGQKEKQKKRVNRRALARLEGREWREEIDEDVASCYEAMGWGGPRRVGRDRGED